MNFVIPFFKMATAATLAWITGYHVKDTISCIIVVSLPRYLIALLLTQETINFTMPKVIWLEWNPQRSYEKSDAK